MLFIAIRRVGIFAISFYSIIIMNMSFLLNFVDSIPFDNLSHLVVNGYEFHWNGYCWEFVGMYY